jgi:phosphoribosylformylglycinamidine cyclo-ligase
MTKEKQSQYEQLGVDPHKESVKKSFREVVSNDFPLAFCNIVRDPLNPGYVLTQHMDGDGSKFIQRILHFKETGDPTVFRGAVDDALSMNTGDIAASGFVNDYFVTDVININGRYVPKDLIMEQLAIRFGELTNLYQDLCVGLTFLGGETADLPDQVRTVAFDICVSSRVLENQLIVGNIEPRDLIYGMASDGKSTWEDNENSGLMSNGLTMARIKLMHESYSEKYPELIREGRRYEGKYFFNDKHELLGDMTVGEAIVSPTRQWALVIEHLINALTRRDGLHLLHGIVMNTGGGATKALNIGKNICYEKEMPEPPPIFKLIQQESGEDWEHMYTSFNCGIGLDVIGSPSKGILKDALDEVNQMTGVKIFKLGQCSCSQKEGNEVRLKTLFGEYSY